MTIYKTWKWLLNCLHVGFQSLCCDVASRMVFVDSQLLFCARMVPGVVILIREGKYFDRGMQNHRKRANEVHKLCIYGRMYPIWN